MGFISARVSFARFKVAGDAPGTFTADHLDQLAARAIGKQRLAGGDGVEIGWTAGGHMLDTSFDLAKNVVNDTLQFGMRVDSLKLPSDLLKAYTAIDLEALAAKNPSGRPTARQKREARDSARSRLEAEARDGRYLRRKVYPVLWDGMSNELLVATTSEAVLDRLHTLFEQTFDAGFEPLASGPLAHRLAESRRQTRGVDDAEPSPFVPGLSPSRIEWVLDDDSKDYLGNEFLLWLWYTLDSESDTIRLTDKTDVVAMVTRTLALECPRAQTGRETITHEAPTRLPEARRAIQSGKLPRKAGLILARQGSQYEFTLSAETLAVGAAKLPAPEETEERARLEERVTQVRHLIETLDLLYDAFGNRRHSESWAKDLPAMQKWLAREERQRVA
ncbi:MAG: hypothetical protein ACRC33_02665 [Gemmataceae bacterium]